MRTSLNSLLKNAVCIEMLLPDRTKNIDKTVITTSKDVCFKTKDENNLALSIYNGIVEYAINEFEIDYNNLAVEQMKVLTRRMRYNSEASDLTKSKYGFYGEVLLDLILRCFLKTNVLIARGYLYQPVSKSEVPGFDAFHLREMNGEIELWVGEAKFYQKYKKPIDDVLSKIEYSLSDNYMRDNFLTIMDREKNFTTSCSKLNDILDRWEANPSINIGEEISRENMTVVYPIMIAHESMKKVSYEDDIKEIINYVKTKVDELGIKISNSFQYKIFFIILPVDGVDRVKEKVFKWIDSKEPLI